MELLRRTSYGTWYNCPSVVDSIIKIDGVRMGEILIVNETGRGYIEFKVRADVRFKEGDTQ